MVTQEMLERVELVATAKHPVRPEGQKFSPIKVQADRQIENGWATLAGEVKKAKQPKEKE